MQTGKPLSNYFRGNNALTPYVIRYGETAKYIYELSEGHKTGPFNLYGVTVYKRRDLSNCFYTLQEAQEYIKTLDKK